MRPITKIIIQKIEVDNLSQLIEQHIKEGMAMVGFHYMIESDGAVDIGRPISSIGNHLICHNSNSIGIATIGKQLTKKQESSIDALLEELELKAPDAKEVLVVEDGELKKYK